MPRTSRSTATRILWLTTAAYWLGIFTLTHVPAPHLPTVHVSDKLEHLISYGGLGTLLFLSLWAARPTWTQIGILTVAIGMMYGAIDEWLQALPFVNRDCDFLDWTADTAGLALAVVVLTFIRWRWERRVSRSNVS
jgi:VanZ family protein